jgi:hypothetical protein
MRIHPVLVLAWGLEAEGEEATRQSRRYPDAIRGARHSTTIDLTSRCVPRSYRTLNRQDPASARWSGIACASLVRSNPSPNPSPSPSPSPNPNPSPSPNQNPNQSPNQNPNQSPNQNQNPKPNPNPNPSVLAGGRLGGDPIVSIALDVLVEPAERLGEDVEHRFSRAVAV